MDHALLCPGGGRTHGCTCLGVYCWHVSGIYAVVMPSNAYDATMFIAGMPSFLTVHSLLVVLLAALGGGGGGAATLTLGCVTSFVVCNNRAEAHYLHGT